MQEPVVVEFIIQPGAPFVGREVRDLGLPAGCILVRCSDGKQEWLPKAGTRLAPHMHITAVIAPEADRALTQLRDGCGPTEKRIGTVQVT